VIGERTGTPPHTEQSTKETGGSAWEFHAGSGIG
jgi:hypothetical protein